MTNGVQVVTESATQFDSAIMHLFQAAHLTPAQGGKLLKFIQTLDDYCQLRFSVALEGIGYGATNARLVAKQIIPKPILYALLVRFQIPEITSKVIKALQQADTNGTMDQYLDLIYSLMLPEIFVYLMDQTMDGYNSPELDSRVIEQEVNRGWQELAKDPAFYMKHLTGSWQCYEEGRLFETYPLYTLLIPLFDVFNQFKVSNIEIQTIFQTMSDVISGQQLVNMAWYGSDIPDQPYYDFVAKTASKSDPIHVVNENLDRRSQLFVRHTIGNVGLSLVTASTFLFEHVHALANSAESSLLFAEALTTYPHLVRFTRITEALIRLADDYSDLMSDIEHDAPNLFRITEDHPLSTQQDARDTFARVLYPDFEIDPMFKELSHVLKRDPDRLDVIKHLINFWHWETQKLLGYYEGDAWTPMLSKVLNIYKAIATGAIEVNGKLSDDDVANF